MDGVDKRRLSKANRVALVKPERRGARRGIELVLVQQCQEVTCPAASTFNRSGLHIWSARVR